MYILVIILLLGLPPYACGWPAASANVQAPLPAESGSGACNSVVRTQPVFLKTSGATPATLTIHGHLGWTIVSVLCHPIAASASRQALGSHIVPVGQNVDPDGMAANCTWTAKGGVFAGGFVAASVELKKLACGDSVARRSLSQASPVVTQSSIDCKYRVFSKVCTQSDVCNADAAADAVYTDCRDTAFGPASNNGCPAGYVYGPADPNPALAETFTEELTPSDCTCAANVDSTGAPDGSFQICDISSTRTGTCCVHEKGVCCSATSECADLSNYQGAYARLGVSLAYLCATDVFGGKAHFLEDKMCSKNPCCTGLATVTGPALRGNQVVINDAFMTSVELMVACAEGLHMKLIVQSTSRCGVPTDSGDPDIKPAINSNHLIGMAIDTNLELPGGEGCNRSCMAAGYCAFHAHVHGCKVKFPKSPPMDDKHRNINEFFTCVRSEGIRVGARFHTPDRNHFDGGGAPSSTAKEAYQEILKTYCKDECPNVRKHNPGKHACNC